MGHLPSSGSLSPSKRGSNEKHDTGPPSLDSEKSGSQYEPMSGQRHDRNRAKERIIWISTAPPPGVDDPSGRTAIALVLSTVLVLVVNAGIWALVMMGPGSWVRTGSGVGVGGADEVCWMCFLLSFLRYYFRVVHFTTIFSWFSFRGFFYKYIPISAPPFAHHALP